MLSPAYLARKLTSPIPTKDGGTLNTIGEACEYMAAIGKERELRPHWQRVRELMLQEADVAALSSRVLLAVLKDAKLDVTALSKPIERWMDEPLSEPAGALDHRFSAWRRCRPGGAPYRAVALGTAGPAGCNRKPAGCRHLPFRASGAQLS